LAANLEHIMAISSPGIGSGLDVNSIVTQLVALEKQPLQQLQTRASGIQSQISLVGKIQSQLAALQTAAQSLSSSTKWGALQASVSDATVLSAQASSGATAGSYSVMVNDLAKSEVAATAKVNVDDAVGGGTLSITAGGSTVDVAVADGSSLSDIAAAINAEEDVGVRATVVRDGSGQEQLVLKAKNTGAAGFSVAVTDNDGDDTDATGLSMFAYSGGTGSLTQVQPGNDASVEIDGLPIQTASNTLDGVVPGLKLTLTKTTDAPVDVVVSSDAETAKTSIGDFVKAYNELNNTLRTALKYDEATKVAGPLQGDTVMIGVQRALRNMLSSTTGGAGFSRLSEIGLDTDTSGALVVNDSKLSAALERFDDVEAFFTLDTGNQMTEGLARKFDTMTSSLLDFEGTLANKTDALERAQQRITDEQTKINERAVRMEARLRTQYAALDAKLGGMQSISSYVAQWASS
jgi:flagellar hook-associated protein 2